MSEEIKPDVKPDAIPAKPTSAEIVDDDKPRKIRKLEEKISGLEDLLSKAKGERDELQTKFNELTKKLTGTSKRSIFKEIEEELWGKESKPNE